jgi:hypothetical protein
MRALGGLALAAAAVIARDPSSPRSQARCLFPWRGFRARPTPRTTRPRPTAERSRGATFAPAPGRGRSLRATPSGSAGSASRGAPKEQAAVNAHARSDQRRRVCGARSGRGLGDLTDSTVCAGIAAAAISELAGPRRGGVHVSGARARCSSTDLPLKLLLARNSRRIVRVPSLPPESTIKAQISPV